MILNILGLLALIVLIAVLINAFEDNRKKSASCISFRESMDLVELPVVTFHNKNKKLNFLLDTGSNISYINSSILHLLDHKKTGKEMQTIGIEGNTIDTEFCTMVVTYKEQTFEEDFSAADLDAAFSVVKQESGVQIHGILGSKFFEKYKYVLDFKDLIAYIK